MNAIFPSAPRFAERPPPFPLVAVHSVKVTPLRVRIEAAVMSTAKAPPLLVDVQIVKVVKEMSTAHAAESER